MVEYRPQQPRKTSGSAMFGLLLARKDVRKDLSKWVRCWRGLQTSISISEGVSGARNIHIHIAPSLSLSLVISMCGSLAHIEIVSLTHVYNWKLEAAVLREHPIVRKHMSFE